MSSNFLNKSNTPYTPPGNQADRPPAFVRKPWMIPTAFLAGVLALLVIELVPIRAQLFALSERSHVMSLAVEAGSGVPGVFGATGGDVFIPPPVPPPALPEFVGEVFDSTALTADGVMVKDVETGAVLFRKNEYGIRPLASITKLMSALVILERNPDWSATTTVVSDDLVDTHMYAGDTYTLEELWEAGLIASSNKAIMTLADAVGWPREAFVARMNGKALELGMSDSRFVEPTGLDEGNISTPSDVIILLSAALKEERIQEVVLESELTIYSEEREKKHHMWSTNWLLLGWIPNTFMDMLGGKTGYIPAAGYNFTTRVVGEEGQQLDVVVLGAESHEARFTEARDVADWALSAYAWPQDDIKQE